MGARAAGRDGALRGASPPGAGGAAGRAAPCEAPHSSGAPPRGRCWRSGGANRPPERPLLFEARRSFPRPAALRQELFGAAAATEAPASTIADAAATRLGLTREELLERLFADLPGSARCARRTHRPRLPRRCCAPTWRSPRRSSCAPRARAACRGGRASDRAPGQAARAALHDPRRARSRPPHARALGPVLALPAHAAVRPGAGRALAASRLVRPLRAARRLLTPRSAGDCLRRQRRSDFPAAPPALYDSRLEERFAGEIASWYPTGISCASQSPCAPPGRSSSPIFSSATAYSRAGRS